MIILYFPLKAVLIASGLLILITGIALVPILDLDELFTTIVDRITVEIVVAMVNS